MLQELRPRTALMETTTNVRTRKEMGRLLNEF